MKKMIFFLPIVVLLFLFQPTFNAEAFGGIVPNITDPGGGGGGGGDSYGNAIPINIGNIGTTVSKCDFMSEDRVEVYYKFTAPGTGDYYFNITPDNSLSMYAELDNSVYYPQGSSNNWDDNNAVSFDVQLSSGQTYYLVVENSSLFDSGFVTSSIFRADVNTKEHPQSINAGVAVNSSIDYIGDADYYTFTPNVSEVWGYKTTGITNVNISIICNTPKKIVDNNWIVIYGESNYLLTNNSFYAFKQGYTYTIRIQGLTTGNYRIEKYDDIGMQTIGLNSSTFNKSVVYTYANGGLIEGYFTNAEEARLYIDEALAPNLPFTIGSITISVFSLPVWIPSAAIIYTEADDNISSIIATENADNALTEYETGPVYISIIIPAGTVHYNITISPWDKNTYNYSDIYYSDFNIEKDHQY